MRLNHLDFYVPDVAKAADFFVRHFGLVLEDIHQSGGRAILADDGGLEIVLSHAVPKFGGIDQQELQRQTYDIGFILPERQMWTLFMHNSPLRVRPYSARQRRSAAVGYSIVPRPAISSLQSAGARGNEMGGSKPPILTPSA
jgi:catechol 2,3-dioxygenase-like lactoylglutathione lyase family enzyme